MSVEIAGKVGPQTLQDGVLADPRLGRLGDVIISELHGRYYEQTKRGNVFNAANQAVATTTVGLATTYTGLCVSNPVGSLVDLVLLSATMMQSVIQATQVEAFSLAVGFNASTQVTHTTPITPSSLLIGSNATAQAKADSSATLPTAPVYAWFIGQTSTATAQPTQAYADIGGSIILKPGAYVIFATPAQASVAGMWFGLTWEEVPV